MGPCSCWFLCSNTLVLFFCIYLSRSYILGEMCSFTLILSTLPSWGLKNHCRRIHLVVGTPCCAQWLFCRNVGWCVGSSAQVLGLETNLTAEAWALPHVAYTVHHWLGRKRALADFPFQALASSSPKQFLEWVSSHGKSPRAFDDMSVRMLQECWLCAMAPTIAVL